MTPDEAIHALEALLSEGLDLCVRAQRLDQNVHVAPDPETGFDVLTRSMTPALWVADQYARDLEAWEARTRDHLRQHGRTLDVIGLTTTAETIRRELD